MPLFKSFLWKHNTANHFTNLKSPYPHSVPHGSPLTLWTSSKHNNQGLYTARGKTDTTWSLLFFSVVPWSLPVQVSPSPLLAHPIKLKLVGREWNCSYGAMCAPPQRRERPETGVYSQPLHPLYFSLIPGRNRREEERAASVAQRRYNNRKKTEQKPLHNLGYGREAFGTSDRTGVWMHLCAWTAHQLHSWVTDGALSLARIGRAAHIPRHAGNAFCDVQLMLTSRRITHQITVRACSLLYALSMSNSSDVGRLGGHLLR